MSGPWRFRPRRWSNWSNRCPAWAASASSWSIALSPDRWPGGRARRGL